MTHRDDVLEQRQDMPLFAPRVRELAHVTDPHTSVAAAAEVIANGTAEGDAAYLLELITRNPGQTIEDHGFTAAEECGGDPYKWRLKLWRRTGTLRGAGAAHIDGKSFGMARWWPGRAPVVIPGEGETA